MGKDGVSILMYHSISHDPGATSIAPDTFRRQMAELAASGVPVIRLRDLLDTEPPPSGAVAITFDDGLVDFAETALPVLREFGFPAINFLPMGRLGGHDDWGRSGSHRPRPILTPGQVKELAQQGVAFGAHSLSHADLTTLDPVACRREVVGSGDALAELLGAPCDCFAAPYGAVNGAVLDLIAGRYALAVGTRLARARLGDPRHDLPRIEMHYFSDPRRWRGFLAHREAWYLRGRQLLRGVRRAAIDAARVVRVARPR